jgi:D-arabinose 1-dehydrogenase-like Zn-dependent alcohol dehydrogenase
VILITDTVTSFAHNPAPSGDGHFVKHTRIIVTRYGGPDALQLIEEECPQSQPGEVRVKVLAAGVSLPDVLAREGVHPETPRVPYTPGWDLVGMVDQIGEAVSGFEPGQTVAATPISGCYAQYVCLPQRKCIPVPPGLEPAEAVAVVLNYITAPDAASFGEGKARAARTDSRRLRRCRHCVPATGATRRPGNLRNVFRAGDGDS